MNTDRACPTCGGSGNMPWTSEDLGSCDSCGGIGTEAGVTEQSRARRHNRLLVAGAGGDKMHTNADIAFARDSGVFTALEAATGVSAAEYEHAIRVDMAHRVSW